MARFQELLKVVVRRLLYKTQECNVRLYHAKKLNTALHITSARLYVAGINLWTATKYPGDPEVNTQTLGNIGGGQDFYTIPQPKTITLGLNVKF